MSEGYNGWSNYETWNVNLWLANEEPTYRDITRLANRYENDEDGQVDLGEAISKYVWEIFDASGGSFGDLDTLAEIEEVNWTEIAAAWLDD